MQFVCPSRPCPTNTDLATIERTSKDVEEVFIWSNGDLEDSSRTGTAPVLKVDTHDVAMTYENDNLELLESNDNKISID